MSTTITRCPKCGGECWDETRSKFYEPGKPTWKCKDKACGAKGIQQPQLPPKNGSAPPQQSHIGVQAVSTPPMQISSPTPRILQEAPRLTLELIGLHHACFKQALTLAAEGEAMGIGSDLTAVSALTAQLFIAATKS